MIQKTLENTKIKNRKVMLLALKPKWADEILSGNKRWEYRRVTMHVEPNARMLFYASGDIHAIVGEAIVDTVLNEPLDLLIQHTVDDVPEKEADLRRWFIGRNIGHAIKIKHPVRYEKPLTLDIIREHIYKFMPPQGFYYLKDEHPLLRLLPSK